MSRPQHHRAVVVGISGVTDQLTGCGCSHSMFLTLQVHSDKTTVFLQCWENELMGLPDTMQYWQQCALKPIIFNGLCHAAIVFQCTEKNTVHTAQRTAGASLKFDRRVKFKPQRHLKPNLIVSGSFSLNLYSVYLTVSHMFDIYFYYAALGALVCIGYSATKPQYFLLQDVRCVCECGCLCV